MYSVYLDKKMKMPSVKRNVLTPVPGYQNRLIPSSWTLTCVKTPVRPPANIARPAPMRNICDVSETMSQCVTTLISGVMDTQSVMEHRMNLLEMMSAIRHF